MRLLCAIALCCVGLTLAGHAEKHLSIAFFSNYNPWKMCIANGYFEQWTGYSITWRHVSSGGRVIRSMQNGELDLAMIGSSPAAFGFSKNLEQEMVWVVEDIDANEALVVRPDIVSPHDLIGRKIGTPFGSTAHFHMQFFMDLMGIKNDQIELVAVSPGDMAGKYEAGEIDGIFSWNPSVSQVVNLGGKVMVNSGTLTSWGKGIFNGLFVNKKFAHENFEFMSNFIRGIATCNQAYLDNPWTEDADQTLDIKNMIHWADTPELLATRKLAPVLAGYKYMTMEEQLTCAWLGCGPAGNIAVGIKAASEFHVERKNLVEALDDYSKFINTSYLEDALTKPLFDFGAVTKEKKVYTVLTDLSKLCSGIKTLTGTRGYFVDGHEPNSAYQKFLDCGWVIENPSGGKLLLNFTMFSLLGGLDFFNVYAGTDNTGDILAVFSGYDLPPPVVTTGPIFVSFKTSNYVPVYYGGGPEHGFNASYTIVASVCATDQDCGGAGAGTCVDGMCACELGYFGATCATNQCQGTTKLSSPSGSFVHGSAKTGHNANCVWVINTGLSDPVMLRFPVFDTEFGYDFVTIYDGLDTTAPVLGKFSGNSQPPLVKSTSGTMLVTFTTDNLTPAPGFRAEYTSAGSVCADDTQCSGHGKCSSSSCLCDLGYFGSDCSSSFCLGVVPLLNTTGRLKSQAGDRMFYGENVCMWDISIPNLHTVRAGESVVVPATGVLLDLLTFDIEAGGFDSLTVSASGLEDLVLSGVSSVCLRNSDCNDNGECVKPNEADPQGNCVCKPGFSNGDCSIQSPIRIESPSVTLKYSGDKSNPVDVRGFDIRFQGDFPCLNDCSGNGDCVLGVCQCYEGATGEDCSTGSCRLGYYFDFEKSRCLICGKGEYNDDPRASACTPCQPGYYQPTNGASECIPCAPGYFSEYSNQHACQLCPTNQFSDKNATVTCDQCPPGTSNFFPGLTDVSTFVAVSRMQCRCLPHYYGADGSECEPCPTGGRCCDCTNTTDDDCSKCLVGNRSPIAMAGYIASEPSNQHGSGRPEVSQAAVYIVKCHDEGQGCLGGADNLCAAGYRGRRCGECKPNYFRSGANCYKCYGGHIFLVVLLPIAVILLIVFFMWVAVNHFRLASVIILADLFQGVALMKLYQLEWPESVISLFNVASLLNFNVELFAPECVFADIPYYSRWLLWMFFPWIFAAALALLSLVFGGLQNQGLKRPEHPINLQLILWNDASNSRVWLLVSTWIAFMFAFYTAVVMKSVEMFICSRNADMTYSLVAAPWLDCYTPEHYGYMGAAYFTTILYGFGTPGLFVFWMRKQANTPDPEVPGDTMLHSVFYRRLLGVIFEGYKSKFYYWDSIDMLRNLAMILGPAIFAGSPIFLTFYGMLVLLSYLVLEIYLHPFKFEPLNLVDLFVDAYFVLVLMGGTYFYTGKLDDGWDGGSTLMIVVLYTGFVGNIISLVAAIFVETKHTLRLHLESKIKKESVFIQRRGSYGGALERRMSLSSFSTSAPQSPEVEDSSPTTPNYVSLAFPPAKKTLAGSSLHVVTDDEEPSQKTTKGGEKPQIDTQEIEETKKQQIEMAAMMQLLMERLDHLETITQQPTTAPADAAAPTAVPADDAGTAAQGDTEEVQVDILVSQS